MTGPCEKCGRHAELQEVPTPAQVERMLARQPNAEVFIFQLCATCAAPQPMRRKVWSPDRGADRHLSGR